MSRRSNELAIVASYLTTRFIQARLVFGKTIDLSEMLRVLGIATWLLQAKVLMVSKRAPIVYKPPSPS